MSAARKHSARRDRSQPSRAYVAAQQRAKEREIPSEPASALESFLAYGAVALIVLSVIAYFTAILVSSFSSREDLAQGFWQVVVFVAYVGLPAGFVMIVTLLILSGRRRRRAQQKSRAARRS